MSLPPTLPVASASKARSTGRTIALIFLVGAVLIALFLAFVFGIVSYSFHNSYVFNEAIRRAERNPTVMARIGTPLKSSWLLQGNIRIVNDSGTARMEIPVSGPHGKAMIRLDASKTSGEWKFTVLELEFEGGTAWIDLLEPTNTSNARST